MDNLLEEIEIKIEYNESFEMDPLWDTNINSPETNFRTEIKFVSHDNNHSSISSKMAEETCKVKTLSDDTSVNFNDGTTVHSYTNDYDNTTKSDARWYDSIDKSGRFSCKFCDLKYSTLQTLRFHVKSKHPEQASHIKENLVKFKRNSKLKCHICKKRFKEILALKTHVLNNHSIEYIKTSCLYCDAVFKTENEMSEHLFVQHNKVTYKATHICNICGYRTSTKSHYNQHKNIHEADKTKKCQYCDYATNYLPNLKIHERIHTKDKIYVCDYIHCNYRCSAKSALRSHQLKHNPEDNILYCDKCSYKTIYKQSLKRHEDCHRRNSIRLKMP